MRHSIRLPIALLGCGVAAGLAGCGGEIDTTEGQSITLQSEGLSGCHGHAASAVPGSGSYFLTTFGYSAGDDGKMSCGSYTKHGSWYYAASRQRYGCGARIRIEANGKCVVAQTDDYGPDECVERGAGGPIIDASPLVAEHLFGRHSAGWSDHLRIHVSRVAAQTPLGPCKNGGGPMNPPPPPHKNDPCPSTTLGKTMPPGTCVQSSNDGKWYECKEGAWQPGHSGCTSSYPFCHSSTLNKAVPPRTCVQSRADRRYYQCGKDGAWVQPVHNGAGPVGTCSAEHSL